MEVGELTPTAELATCWKCCGSGSLSSGPDQRHVCWVCGGAGTIAPNADKKLLQRQSVKSAKAAARHCEASFLLPAQREPWSGALDGLNEFPMQASMLDHGTMVADLDERRQELLWAYLAAAVPASPELRRVFESVALEQPTALRVKELFETVEAFKQSAQWVVDVGRAQQVDTLYDLACGHGMLGALLAYRFPRKKVVCVDLERRPGFDAVVRAFEAHGEAPDPRQKPPPAPGVLGNLSFVEADFAATLETLGPRSLVLAVHACNEANQQVVEGARVAGAVWGVMPCCIRDGIYLPCGLWGSRPQDGSDDDRHILQCGALAATYKAERMSCIDRRITNRHIFIFGGSTKGVRST